MDSSGGAASPFRFPEVLERPPPARGSRNEPGSVTSPGSAIQSFVPGHSLVAHLAESEQA